MNTLDMDVRVHDRHGEICWAGAWSELLADNPFDPEEVSRAETDLYLRSHHIFPSGVLVTRAPTLQEGTMDERTLLELRYDGPIPPDARRRARSHEDDGGGSPAPAVPPPPPLPMSPEERRTTRPTHSVDDGRNFWMFPGRAEADAFAKHRANHYHGRVYTVSEINVVGTYREGAPLIGEAE